MAGAPNQNDNVGKLLSFFSISWRTIANEKFFERDEESDGDAPKARLFCSAGTFVGLLQEREEKSIASRAWGKGVHSVFVYAGDNSDSLQRLVRLLVQDESIVLQKRNSGPLDFVLSDRWDDFCGVMSGIRATAPAEDVRFIPNISKGNVFDIISSDSGAVLLKISYQGLDVFLSTSTEIIDIGENLTSRGFDVREHFLSAVPIVLYIKWAFAQKCWQAPDVSACLVIDDPVLKPKYGCLDFEKLFALMVQHNFSTSIAFIPWNWQRSQPAVAGLFRKNPDRYSLSIHGCDHTAAEFGDGDRDRIRRKAGLAVKRMRLHESKTGLGHDRVMVFPQGIFSEAAMTALKHADFVAAVNTEMISVDRDASIKISDAWDVAVMSYAGFPLFTRRYPSQGIENFAFDILLGKPCIAVIHHDYCRDRYAHVVKFVEALNRLNCRLSWRGLGEVVKHSYRQRELSPGVIEIEMYANEILINNNSDRVRHFSIRRREIDSSSIDEIHDESGAIPWSALDGHISFEVELRPGQKKTISLAFKQLSENGHGSDGNIAYRFKTMMRRYASEVRDNYVTPARFKFSGSR